LVGLRQGRELVVSRAVVSLEPLERAGFGYTPHLKRLLLLYFQTQSKRLPFEVEGLPLKEWV
jgi:hypothetical protein